MPGNKKTPPDLKDGKSATSCITDGASETSKGCKDTKHKEGATIDHSN